LDGPAGFLAITPQAIYPSKPCLPPTPAGVIVWTRMIGLGGLIARD